MSEKKYNLKDSEKIAENNYDSSYDQADDSQFKEGLAETREQVADDYQQGTIDQKKDKDNK
ncbi:DUF4025 domain-containing protein [Allobacillus sp. SKP2-8]|uniref:YozQ family protein n=1 Tax=unclassified Allobacillus TaxID=2628859 RepID=UPI00118204BA|nr:YozQ family protein [Allobacillus sp. SKP2-8]TSJ65019.1 DUF4025 domain-containing protein [Allobacillus sp. SKP2-8]